jgi:hypothetical protein
MECGDGHLILYLIQWMMYLDSTGWILRILSWLQ